MENWQKIQLDRDEKIIIWDIAQLEKEKRLGRPFAIFSNRSKARRRPRRKSSRIFLH